MTQRRARRKPGENWERLLQAGLHEFGLYGYHGTSTARIASRADVPQPHLYANFDGKADLFLLCLKAALDALEPSTERDAGSKHPVDLSGVAVTQPLGDLIVYQAVAASRDPAVGARIRSMFEVTGFTSSRNMTQALTRAAHELASLRQK